MNKKLFWLISILVILGLSPNSAEGDNYAEPIHGGHNIYESKPYLSESYRPHQFKNPIDYYDIVYNSIYASTTSNSESHPNGLRTNHSTDGYELLKRVSCGPEHYADGDNKDELDMYLYKQSEEYAKDLITYNNLRKTTFYSIGSLYREPKFSTSGIELDCRNSSYDESLQLASIGGSPEFPIKANSYGFFSTVFKFPISDIEVLKKLKQAKRIQILLTYLPGFTADEYGRMVVKPTGLYLYDATSGDILFDLSNLLGRYDEAAISKKIRTAAAQEEARMNKKPPYHKQTKRVRCGLCSGKGYWEEEFFDSNNVWTTRKHRCTNCYGKGYEDTHYYY